MFVAEKKAALDVVKTRLDKANIGDLCLELHSNKANKVNLLKDLSNSIEKLKLKKESTDKYYKLKEDTNNKKKEHLGRTLVFLLLKSSHMLVFTNKN